MRRGRIVTQWDADKEELRTSYSDREFRRSFAYRIEAAGSSPVNAVLRCRTLQTRISRDREPVIKRR